MCSCALVVDLLAFWMFAMCMWAYVLTNVYLVCCHCKSKEFQLFNFYLQLKIRHTQFPIMPIDDDNLFRWIKLLMRFGLVCVYANTIRSLVANLYMYLLRWMSMFRSKKDVHPFIRISCSNHNYCCIFLTLYLSIQQRTVWTFSIVNVSLNHSASYKQPNRFANRTYIYSHYLHVITSLSGLIT